MDAAAILVHKFKQRAGECSRYRKHSESLSAAEAANALSPLFETTALAVRRRCRISVEQDHFLRSAIALIRELKHLFAGGDCMPTRARNGGYALIYFEGV